MSFTTEPTANGEGIRDKGNLFITSILQNALLVKEKTKKSLSLSSSQNNTQAEAEAVVFEDSAEQAAAADGEGATTVKDDTDQKNASVPERKTYYGGFTIDEMDHARGLVKNFDLLSRDTKVRALFECVPQSTAKKIWVRTAYKAKSGNGQVLNIVDGTSTPQLTSKTPLDYPATDNSISDFSEKVNKKSKKSLSSSQKASPAEAEAVVFEDRAEQSAAADGREKEAVNEETIDEETVADGDGRQQAVAKTLRDYDIENRYRIVLEDDEEGEETKR